MEIQWNEGFARRERRAEGLADFLHDGRQWLT